jgi:ketosteroid isomerase-like protein
MKKIIMMLTGIILLTGNVMGQSALQDLVKTEQAFSKMAEEKDTREAFMAFIADDGLLFRPGAVNGKKWMLDHPVPPSDKNPLLAWQPSFAGMAEAGDMGFTTGPWEFKNDVKDAKPSGYGHFVTVWKKQKDDSWKFVVDLGISHPQSGGLQTLWHPAAQSTSSKPTIYSDAAAESLLARDREFGDAGVKQGLTKAFTRYASPDVRLYRSGHLPFIGRPASVKALAEAKGDFSWKQIGGDASISADLGYTHGTYEVTDATKKVIEQGSYVRIWKKQAGVWQIALDVINAH